MRLSVMPGDAGYRAYRCLPRSVRPRVFLDGEAVRRCATADTRRGFVLVFAMDTAGQAVLNARRTDVKMERRYGRVEILLTRSCGLPSVDADPSRKA